MFTAKEAREKATSITNQINQRQLGRVHELVSTAVSTGKLETWLDVVLNESVTKHLESLGYKITSNSDGRNGNNTKISW
jgi:hypothetical protein